MLKRTLVLTDNLFLYDQFKIITGELNLPMNSFDFGCSTRSFLQNDAGLILVNVKKDTEQLIEKYSLIISLHCRQLFPAALLKNIRCINIHPGYNPYNRGWYPQVFSIINKLPAGATIHEIDEQIDHGKIIAQKKTEVYSWDTSLTIYNRVLETELVLIREYLPALIKNEYESHKLCEEGNLNLKADFTNLCEIDLNETVKAGDFIDRLRALTHGDFKNAHFTDLATGKRVYLSLDISPGE